MPNCKADVGTSTDLGHLIPFLSFLRVRGLNRFRGGGGEAPLRPDPTDLAELADQADRADLLGLLDLTDQADRIVLLDRLDLPDPNT